MDDDDILMISDKLGITFVDSNFTPHAIDSDDWSVSVLTPRDRALFLALVRIVNGKVAGLN